MNNVTVKLLRFIPGFIRRDFIRKMIALALAALIYFSITERSAQTTTITDVPVKCALPESLIDIGGRISTVTLTVKATEHRLKNLNAKDFSIVLPFPETMFEKGQTTYQLPVRIEKIKKPLGSMVIDCDKMIIPFEIDKMESILLPIKPDYSLDAPVGYRVGKVSFATPEVMVSGPDNMLKNLNSIPTEPIPLGQTTQSFSYTVKLRSPNPSITLTPSEVMVNVEVVKDSETRKFENVPVRILYNSQTSKTLTVDFLSGVDAKVGDGAFVDITVEGIKNVVDHMVLGNLNPYIDISLIGKPGLYNINVSCWVDRDDIRIKNIHPELLSVRIMESTHRATREAREAREAPKGNR